MKEQMPVAKFRAGSVSCAVWENDITVGGQPQKVLKAQVSRRYRDRNGAWQTTQSFTRNEIPLAIYVMGKAFAAMIERPADQEEQAAAEEEKGV